jgi:hypothetical protein
MMKSAISRSIIWWRSEILMYIARAKSDRWIARETYYERDLISEVRRGLDFPSGLFALSHSLRVPRKVNNDLISEVA